MHSDLNGIEDHDDGDDDDIARVFWSIYERLENGNGGTRIDTIKRPVKSLALQGVITTVHGNCGLVKRCNKCKSIFYEDACPNKCPIEEGWGWDLRVSCRLYDNSGSMKMVLTKDIAMVYRFLINCVLSAKQYYQGINKTDNIFILYSIPTSYDKES